MSKGKRIGVLLAGSGHRDGSEIHESAHTILAISRAGAQPVFIAPAGPQKHVFDHATGEPLMLAQGAPAWIALAAFGVLASPPSSLIMAAAGRALSPESRAFGMGVHYTLFYLGVALLPPLAGLVRDMTGNPAAPILTGAGFLAASLLGIAVYARAMRG